MEAPIFHLHNDSRVVSVEVASDRTGQPSGKVGHARDQGIFGHRGGTRSLHM